MARRAAPQTPAIRADSAATEVRARYDGGRTEWYEVRPAAAAANAVVLDIHGPVGGAYGAPDDSIIDAKAIADALARLDDSVDTIIVQINSAGGSGIEAIHIAETLRAQRERGRAVIVRIGAIAASAASLIAAAGSVIEMPENAMLMIHNPYTPSVAGDSGRLRNVADMLEKITDSFVRIYGWATTLPAAEIRSMMAAETWMSARDALARGFVTRVTPTIAVAASMATITNLDHRRLRAQLERAGNRSAIAEYLNDHARATLEAVMPDENIPQTAVPAMAEATQPTLPATPAAEQAPPPAPAPTEQAVAAPPPQPAPAPVIAPQPAPAGTAEVAAAVEAERTRARDIHAIVERASLPQALAQEMIADGSDLNAVRARVLDDLSTASDSTAPLLNGSIEVGDDRAFLGRVNAMEVGILSRTVAARHAVTTATEEASAGDIRLPKLDWSDRRYCGHDLTDLARASLDHAHPGCTNGRSRDEIIARAFAAGGNMQTRSDFSTALENVMNKVLLSSYRVTPDQWSRVCGTTTLNDFRPHDRHRMSFLQRLHRLGENGEIQNQPIPDTTKERIQASTWADIVAITRQTLVDDDIGLFERLVMQLGRAAKLSVELEFFDKLKENGGLGPVMADGNTLYHASHNNISTSAALTVAGIETDRVTLALQKDRSGNEVLDMDPEVLLVSKTQGGKARAVNRSEHDPDTTGRRENINRGLFSDIVETARLSGARRYLFVDRMVNPVFEVGFVNGVSEPMAQMKDSWRMDGCEFKILFDFAVAPTDFVGTVTNAGT